ncbi:hypothetical protein QHG49_00660 [Streptomyces sp. WP-1]|nr:hypothetical protein [Streptomyces sp. WP-1]WKE74023.1 hypothetical protein QHG49_00660 [Streptomyces sp. WP-1]
MLWSVRAAGPRGTTVADFGQGAETTRNLYRGVSSTREPRPRRPGSATTPANPGRLREALDGRPEDWAAVRAHAVHSHLCNATARADAATGPDLAAQAGPEFRHGPAVLTIPARLPHPSADRASLMSLDVSPRLLTEAENGAVKGEDFMETVRTSLPYAYALVARRSCAGVPVAVDAIRVDRVGTAVGHGTVR